MAHTAHYTPCMRHRQEEKPTMGVKNKDATPACSYLALTTAHWRGRLCESLAQHGRSPKASLRGSQGSNKKPCSAFGKHTPQRLRQC